MTVLSPERQRALRALVDQGDYDAAIENAYLMNPFFRLTEEEARAFRADQNASPVRRLISIRDEASRIIAPKYSVFCMPKSGSSFVRTALQCALQLPVMSLTGFGTPGASSVFGMNSREQELDELALTKAILKAPTGFVSQNHTRFSTYLALQMKMFGITPIVTVRNILDCIVSFDDMMRASKAGSDERNWIYDPQFALPLNYIDLEDAARFEILAKSFGVWLIGFFLSWKRGREQQLISPIFIKYEEDILNPDRFVKVMTENIAMNDEQISRITEYAGNPSKSKSRFNIGISGRGRRVIPIHLIDYLTEYAEMFRGELTDDEIRYLI